MPVMSMVGKKGRGRKHASPSFFLLVMAKCQAQAKFSMSALTVLRASAETTW